MIGVVYSGLKFKKDFISDKVLYFKHNNSDIASVRTAIREFNKTLINKQITCEILVVSNNSVHAELNRILYLIKTKRVVIPEVIFVNRKESDVVFGDICSVSNLMITAKSNTFSCLQSAAKIQNTPLCFVK